MPDPPLLHTPGQQQLQQQQQQHARMASHSSTVTTSTTRSRSPSPSFVSALDNHDEYGNDHNDENGLVNHERSYNQFGYNDEDALANDSDAVQDDSSSTTGTAIDITASAATHTQSHVANNSNGGSNSGSNDHDTSGNSAGAADPAIASGLTPCTTTANTPPASTSPDPGVTLTLLLISGRRVTLRIDAAFLKNHDLLCDPSDLLIDDLKACLVNDWDSKQWGVCLGDRPSSPSSIRLIYFGKILESNQTLAQCNLLTSSLPPIIHLSVRPDTLCDCVDSRTSGDKLKGVHSSNSHRRRSRGRPRQGSRQTNSSNTNNNTSDTIDPDAPSSSHGCCIVA